MSWHTGVADVCTEAELREVIGTPLGQAVAKERRALHALDREWLAASPLCLIATCAPDGSCDVSPKGDPPGFALALDDTTIAIPDRPGNRRADSFVNILGNPHVGLVFVVPGRDDTLRINGRARIVRDAPFFDQMIVGGHRPALAIVVQIDQIFFHCAKAFMRAKLWRPQSWRPDALPSRAQITKSTQPTEESLAELEAYYGPSYAERLYRT